MVNDLTNGERFPLMKIPNQKKQQKSAFEEKCDSLKEGVLSVYHFFKWYSSRIKSKEDLSRAVMFLEDIFLKILMDIKDIDQERSKILRYENTNDIVKTIQSLHQNAMFLHDKIDKWSGKQLEKRADAMRQDMVEDFHKMAEWLRERYSKDKEQVKELVNDLRLTYPEEWFELVGDSFKEHANMVVMGLMLLAIPSHSNSADSEFGTLFDCTMDEYQKSKVWKSAFANWNEQLEDEIEVSDLVEPNKKLKFFRKGLKILNEKEQALLGDFGIAHTNIRNADDKATMGSRIYEHLNSEEEEDNARMETSDLQEYFSYVAQKQYLNEEIDKIKRQFFTTATQKKEDKTQKRRLFKKSVDEGILAECFKEVYDRFFEPKNVEKTERNVLTLIINLFIIAEKKDYFFNSSKPEMKTFFCFCTEKALFQPTPTARTFHNWMSKKKFIDFREKIRQKKLTITDYQSTIYEDYQKIFGIFRGTKKYIEIQDKK